MAVQVEEDEKRAVADWMTTYADLMSLLMCFFVLLLSFSEMDVAKYKQLAGSMKMAFGVQNEVKVKFIPKGTSIIAKEFSPGRPNPTAVKTVQQQSTNTRESSLDMRTSAPGKNERRHMLTLPSDIVREEIIKARQKETVRAAEDLKAKLQEHIDQGIIEIEFDPDKITVRIRERGSFPSGSATLAAEFQPVIDIIREGISDIDGEISVEGHTDNVPISNARFQSNWSLSSQRALTLTHALLKDSDIPPERFMVVGYADTRPRASNDTPGDRALNRRVEVVIRRDEAATEAAKLRVMKADGLPDEAMRLTDPTAVSPGLLPLGAATNTD